jgi:hypothetical protein
MGKFTLKGFSESGDMPLGRAFIITGANLVPRPTPPPEGEVRAKAQDKARAKWQRRRRKK